MEGDDPTSELLDLLRATTDNAQGLNESDLMAVKVVKLVLPAVSVLSSRMVMETAESQNVKIDKVCAAVRLNRYAIDSQKQYIRRENFRISDIEEAEDENLFDKLQNTCAAMKVTLNKSDIVSCHRGGKKEV